MRSHNETHHHGGPKVYTTNLILLFILTAITVGASYIDFGAANVAIALLIASVKATLVAMLFMHLKWDKPVNAIACVAGFLFLGIFLGFTVLDTGSRRDPDPRNVAGMKDDAGPGARLKGTPAAPEPTPVPTSMNPKLTPPPQPKAKPEPGEVVPGTAHDGKAAEGGAEH